MLRYMTHPWPSIVETYTSIVEHNPTFVPMLTLVQWLACSPYAYGLFPLTSMFTLRIGRSADFLAYDAELSITYESKPQVFTLAYCDGVPKPVWVRAYPEHEVQAALERFFLDYARWFRSHTAAGSSHLILPWSAASTAEQMCASTVLPKRRGAGILPGGSPLRREATDGRRAPGEHRHAFWTPDRFAGRAHTGP